MSVDHSSHIVPYGLEDPVPIMFWDPLEFVLAISFIGFGIIANVWIFGVGVGIGILFGARYLKRGAKRGAMQHFMWAYGLQLDAQLGKCFKPSWINDYTE